jgi:hypothetical protein
MGKKPKLEIVGPSTADPSAPPAMLGKAGRKLWQAIQSEYIITDCGGLALLEQICATVDEIAECSAIIARDGRMIRGKFGPREHPLIKTQLSLRSFVVRTVQKLGINFEATKPFGRPSAGFGWRGGE